MGWNQGVCGREKCGRTSAGGGLPSPVASTIVTSKEKQVLFFTRDSSGWRVKQVAMSREEYEALVLSCGED